MNLTENIISLWTNDATLNNLCSVGRLFFEQVDEKDLEELKRNGEEYPYCVWKELDDSPEEVTSLSFIDESLYQLVIYASTKEEASNIQRESRRLLRKDGNVVPDDDGIPLLFEKRGGSLGAQDSFVYVAVDEYALIRQRSR
jgi:hypothetical protein